MENIGMKIRKLRELRNYTQEYMALNLNITQTAYCKVEKEESHLTISRLKEISVILEVDLLQILTFDESFFFSNISSSKRTEKRITENEQINYRMNQLENEIVTLRGLLINSTNQYYPAIAS